jgi:hypothetical protein
MRCCKSAAMPIPVSLTLNAVTPGASSTKNDRPGLRFTSKGSVGW